jgi:hypothetical protein
MSLRKEIDNIQEVLTVDERSMISPDQGLFHSIPIEPTTLSDVRTNGVRSLLV